MLCVQERDQAWPPKKAHDLLRKSPISLPRSDEDLSTLPKDLFNGSEKEEAHEKLCLLYKQNIDQLSLASLET